MRAFGQWISNKLPQSMIAYLLCTWYEILRDIYHHLNKIWYSLEELHIFAKIFSEWKFLSSKNVASKMTCQYRCVFSALFIQGPTETSSMASQINLSAARRVNLRSKQWAQVWVFPCKLHRKPRWSQHALPKKIDSKRHWRITILCAFLSDEWHIVWLGGMW